MRNLANFALFQGAWFAGVLLAAEGRAWLATAAIAVGVLVHLAVVSDRPSREGALIVGAGILGTLLDSLLRVSGLIEYEAIPAGWPSAIVPPWIIALWCLFATLPAHSLGWLRPRLRLAVVLGAVGGPLAFLGGVRLGALAPAEPEVWTLLALGVEYAVATPILLRVALSCGGGQTSEPSGLPSMAAARRR